MKTKESYENKISVLENENAILKSKLEFNELYNDYSNNWEIFRDQTGKLVYLSPQFEAITGYSCEDFLNGKSEFLILVHPDDKQKVKDALSIQGKRKYVSDLIFRILDKSHNIKYLSVTSQPVFTKDKEFAGTRISCIDISILKQTEISLIESQAILKKIFNNPFEAIMLIDEEGRITEWNSCIAKTTGLTREQVVGEFVWKIQHKLVATDLIGSVSEKTFEDYFRSNAKLLKENEMLTGIGKLLSTNGEIKYVEDVISTFNSNNRKYYCVFQRDITERKKTEEALKEREEHLRLITDNLPVLINHTGLDMRYLFVNNYYTEMFGISKDQFIGKKISESIEKQAFEVGLNYIGQAFNGHTVSFENKIRDKNKQERIFQLILVPEFKGDKVVGFFTIGIDITQQKRSAHIIEQQNSELTKLNNDKDRFMSILAHDLKSPFGSILGFLDLLAENINTYNIKEIEDIINLVNDSSHKTYNLLDDLLNWINARSGKLTCNPEKINFSEICGDVIISLESIAKKKNIKIVMQVSEEIFLLADKNILKTIVRNLINNAIKFTSTYGLIILSVKPGNGFVTVMINDNGIGIEPNVLDNLFDPVHRISTRGTEEETGTGLGLLLCREFVEKLGGKIWAESIPGKGSSFKFTVPVAKK
jgi:PAS domain S-box-containing protein